MAQAFRIAYGTPPLNPPLSSWWAHVGPVGFTAIAYEHWVQRMKGSKFDLMPSLAHGGSDGPSLLEQARAKARKAEHSYPGAA